MADAAIELNRVRIIELEVTMHSPSVGRHGEQ
jgi:hypothetical protein